MAAVAAPARPHLRAVKTGEGAQLAGVLARSYETCPAWGWYLPPEVPNRLRRMEGFFQALLDRVYLPDPHRECVTTDDLAGAVLWDTPGHWKLSAGQTLGMLGVMAVAFRRRLPRAARGFNDLDSGHPGQPHYYLSVLGVDPDADRRGVAEALIEPELERCDREGVPAYLETGRPGSRDFFAAHGFRVIEELRLPGGGPQVWRLWRDPA
jgi:GNAT superfamily N-acetyltransferase